MKLIKDHELNTQALQLAIAVERYSGQLYSDWAYKLRPYDLGSSIILEELAKEELEHERELMGLYKEVTGKKVPASLPEPVELQKLVQSLQSIQNNYFVFNSSMTKIILEMALKIELFSHDFYNQYLKKVKNSQVLDVIRRMAEFEDNHERVLMERLYSSDFSQENNFLEQKYG